MYMRLFQSAGDWLLLPECLQLPLSTNRFKPLSDRGIVDCTLLDGDQKDLIQKGIDEKSYALISDDIAFRMLNANTGNSLSPRKQNPRISPRVFHT